MGNAVCLALLVSVIVHAAFLANPVSVVTYYASPQLEGINSHHARATVVEVTSTIATTIATKTAYLGAADK